jgi:hypothetical protein
MSRRTDSPDDLDRLYQVPLAEFIAERNALAKRSGTHAAAIRALTKPTLPAWAINQLYWRKREIFDDLIARAEDLRATHQAALRGRQTDLRGASRSHEEAVEAALKATLALLAASGNPVTEATRQAVATTLRALPSEEPPGRLTKQLQPRGFDVLGAASAQGKVRSASPAPSTPARKPAAGARDVPDTEARKKAAREAAAAALRSLRDAENAARREEFEVARTVRDADKAERRVAEADEALQQAKEELDSARKAAQAASRARESARTRAAAAARQLEEAKSAEEAARKALDALE